MVFSFLVTEHPCIRAYLNSLPSVLDSYWPKELVKYTNNIGGCSIETQYCEFVRRDIIDKYETSINNLLGCTQTPHLYLNLIIRHIVDDVIAELNSYSPGDYTDLEHQLKANTCPTSDDPYTTCCVFGNPECIDTVNCCIQAAYPGIGHAECDDIICGF